MKQPDRSTQYRQILDSPRVAEYGGLTVVDTLHRPGARTGIHTHPHPRFCLVVAGGFRETLEASEKARGPGSLLFYPIEVSHADWFFDSGARCLNVEWLPAVDLPPLTEVTEFGPRGVAAAYRLFDALHTGSEVSLVRRRAEDLMDWIRSTTNVSSRKRSGSVAEARRLVAERAREGISLATVARTVKMDRYALARAFRLRYGCSVGQYRHRILVRLAREQLLATEDTLAAIAYRNGFADQSHFTRIFKRHTGLPPGRYRRAEA